MCLCVCICVMCVCEGVSTCERAQPPLTTWVWNSEGYLPELVFSYQAGCMVDQIQAIRLDGKHLHPLDALMGLLS